MAQNMIAAKLKGHNYPETFAIFAPIFPLVGMMWADNRVQCAEVELFIKHATAYFKRLNIQSLAISEMTLYNFVNQSVTDQQFACFVSDIATSCPVFDVFETNLHTEILDAAIDIAAASEITTLSGQNIRVTDGEKWWIKKLTLCLAGIHDDTERVEKLATA